ncbi:MAG: M1 family aminopeptidase [Acidobacteriota bacterium]
MSRRFWIVLVALHVMHGPLAADTSRPGATLADLAAAIDRPTVGTVLDLGGGPLALPSGQILPDAGTRVHQLLADGRPCGLYVAGPATFSHRVEDSMSIPVARRNLDRASKLAVRDLDSGGFEITERLKDAVIWTLDLSATVDEASAAGPAFPEWVGERLDRSFMEQPSMLLLTHRGLGVQGAVYALMRGEKEELRLRRDPGVSATEALYRLEYERTSPHPVYKNRWYPQRLVTTPVSRQWWERFPAALVATREVLEVDNPQKEQVIVRATSTLQAAVEGVSVWAVDLWTDVVADRDERPVTIRKVEVDGKPADFLHSRDALLVQLPAPMARGAETTVVVEHEGELAIRPGGDNFWSLGTAPWYPQPPLNGELATVEISVRVPDDFVPMASGEVVERRTVDGYAHLRTRVDKPSQFPVVAAGNYEIFSDTEDGVTCHVATYSGGKEKGARKLIKNFFAARKYFEELFDVPYPFTEFTIVEVNAWGFGQAPPGLIFITKEALQAHPTSAIGRLASQDLNKRFIHEVAHAWWGHVAKMDSLEEQWVTESFANYTAAMGLRAMYGGRKGKKAFDAAIDEWHGTSRRVDEGGSVYLANFFAGEGWSDSEARYLLLYNKGAAVLHAVRLKLQADLGDEAAGDRAFVSFLRSVLKNFTFQWAHTRHMVTILGQISGSDWQPFFDRYIYGTELPPIDDD